MKYTYRIPFSLLSIFLVIACSNQSIDSKIIFECQYMFYACDPCARYKVLKVTKELDNHLLDKDVFLSFSSPVQENTIIRNITKENKKMKIWGTVISDKAKDAGFNYTYKIRVDSVMVLK